MAENNIIDNIEQYFESVKEQFGETLFLERSKKNNSKEKVKKPKLKTLNPKLRTEETSFDKLRMTEKADKSQLPITNYELRMDNDIKLQTPNSKLTTEKADLNDWISSKTVEELYQNINNCQKCSLGKSRTNFVFGTGNPNADIMVIGEAPGADEDEQGKPFVGRAGQLLTKILEAIKLSRDEVFIANILKCRPPNNRKPLASEEDECEPYLKKQIELIKPAFILALGLTAVDCLLKKTHKMGDIRGSVMEYHGIKMLVTYHPAALLRNPNWKPFVWEDVKLLRKLYDEYLANR
jgi:uracil-DNA glycosylase